MSGRLLRMGSAMMLAGDGAIDDRCTYGKRAVERCVAMVTDAMG